MLKEGGAWVCRLGSFWLGYFPPVLGLFLLAWVGWRLEGVQVRGGLTPLSVCLNG